MAKLAADLDGMTMGGLASKGRYGDTMIAHINPQEAQMLMDKGGAGTINPMTGLPEFYFDDPGYTGGDPSDVSDAGGGDAGGGADDDYTEAELEEAGIDPTGLFDDPTPQSTQDIADVADQFGLTIEEAAEFLGPTGVGRGGPAEFGDPGVGRFKDTVDSLRDKFNKEGIPEEFVPYFNALKDRGLTNEQAIDILAGIAGTRGGAQGLFSGFRDGYKYGGPMGTLQDLLETQQMDFLESAAADARRKQAEKDDEGVAPASLADYEEPGFLDKFADMLGLDKLSLDSLNPFSTTLTPEQQAVLDSLAAQGLDTRARSGMDKALGFMASAALPTELSLVQTLGGRLTGTNIIGLATDPVTGFEYLVDASGGLQLAPGELGDPSDMDAGGGNEPTITKKRKEATKPVEEEKEEEKDTPYFPEIGLPRLTESGLKTLQYTLRNDPEALQNIYNMYALPEQYSGLKALV